MLQKRGIRTRTPLFLACLVAGLITAAALCLILLNAGADLRLPLNYLRDANVFLTRAKSIVEGNWIWRNPRLGMPFGANWLDFPMNVTLDSATMWLLSQFTHNAALIVNLDWIISVALTAALAAYAFGRLQFELWLAIACSVAFALQPYTWWGPRHLHSLSCAVPLIAAAAVELILGRIGTLKHVPPYVWIATFLAGLSYIYIAFFCCLVLVCAAGLAWMRQRTFRPAVVGSVLAGCIVTLAAADLAPSMVNAARNGENASMLFKSPAEAELYGLKIRYLLTPSPDHPLKLFRNFEHRLSHVRFPASEDENQYTRLGSIGVIGFLASAGVLLGAAVSRRVAGLASSTILGPCAALILACVLLASVGGLNVFFNVFVTADIRAWERIFPFIGFFSVAVSGALAGPFLARLPSAASIALLGLTMVLAVLDQAMPSLAYDRSDSTYREDETFVREIEKQLPANSMIFELPFVDFPNDDHPFHLEVNDMLRPYLHSQRYRWSAGAVSGTTPAEWNRSIASLPVHDMLNALVNAGFAGLWVDLAGYAPERSHEAALDQVLGAGPTSDSSRRFLFYDLRNYAASMRAKQAAMEVAQLRARNPVQAVFARGFYYAENGPAGCYRWSLRRGRITLINPLSVPRRITLRLYLETAARQHDHVIIAWPGTAMRFQTPGTFEGHIELPAAGAQVVDLSCDCPGIQTADRRLYFYVSNFEARE